jgi:hypothetical protein
MQGHALILIDVMQHDNNYGAILEHAMHAAARTYI